MNSPPPKTRGAILKERFYPESRFGGFSDVDGTFAFYHRIQALATDEMTMLDIGCGRAHYEEDVIRSRRDVRIFKGRVKKVIGIDVDPAGETNPHIDEFHKIEGDCWPVSDASIDLAVCDFVLEHVEDPDAFFREVARVLKPGGLFCARTPNSRSYVALISRLTPNRLHAKVLGKAQDARKEEDVFPTFYRCNTIGKLRRLFKQHGFDAHVTCQTPEPSYLSFSSIAYFMGVLHQRFSPKAIGMVLLAYARKLP